jgi:UPF0716 protein FxsA
VRQQRRSRARTVLPLVVAAWAVLEIWLMTVVADATSGFTVLLLLLAGLVLGAAAVKRAGRSAWRNLTASMQQGTRDPASGDGTAPAAPAGGGRTGLAMLGGLLLMIPGLISDALGLLLLIPPVQKALARYAERVVERKLGKAAPGTLGDAFQQARMHRPDGKVVQGEVIRDEPGSDAPQGPRPPLTR